jgi:pyruvate/2-oxoacid:ferredoxin oxidoreductase alpha subunit
MAMRDAGWVQLYCSDNQEAVDTTIQAFRIAETLEVPVMVCVDGFTLTHSHEAIELPEQEVVDRFLPPTALPAPSIPSIRKLWHLGGARVLCGNARAASPGAACRAGGDSPRG